MDYKKVLVALSNGTTALNSLNGLLYYLISRSTGAPLPPANGHYYLVVQHMRIEVGAAHYAFALWHTRTLFIGLAFTLIFGLLEWVFVDRATEKSPTRSSDAKAEAEGGLRMALGRLAPPLPSAPVATEINRLVDDAPVHDHFVIDDRKMIFQGHHIHVTAAGPLPRAMTELVGA